MTACINKTSLLGFLGDDPVRRETQGGGVIVSLRVATTEHWKGAGGERKSATEWHSVVIFNETQGKTAMSFLRKGSAVYVEGQLRYRKYAGRDHIERTVAEIVLPKFGGDLKLMDRRQDEAARNEPSGRDLAAGDDLDGDQVPF
ncbi:single-stranded DNA-binding protein [Sphingobium sp.]|uniref:single-stranded DNA-binding protein n=1 Tax=Sphingobium sp. TaxID=1912891 RepID=UPI003BB56BF1